RDAAQPGDSKGNLSGGEQWIVCREGVADGGPDGEDVGTDLAVDDTFGDGLGNLHHVIQDVAKGEGGGQCKNYQQPIAFQQKKTCTGIDESGKQSGLDRKFHGSPADNKRIKTEAEPAVLLGYQLHLTIMTLAGLCKVAGQIRQGGFHRRPQSPGRI